MRSDIREKIFFVLENSNKLVRAKLADEATFEDLGFDSLDTVELIVAFEEHIGIDLSDDVVQNNLRNGTTCLYP